jgi:protein-L-isoaspartate(D-aspartate) O-methyltransferase
VVREDNLKFQGARRRMIEKLRERLKGEGLLDERVMDAMMKVPRHYSFESALDTGFAYENTAFNIGAGQTISHPHTVAVQSALLEVQKRHKVLEVGTGSGYQAAVLMELGAKLYSVERQKLLYDKTSKLLPAMGYRARLSYGDGYKGMPAYGPFDRCIVTAAAPYIPDALIDQLKPGGILVIPVGEGEVQDMLRIIKKDDGTTITEEYGHFSFVPMLQKTAR